MEVLRSVSSLTLSSKVVKWRLHLNLVYIKPGYIPPLIPDHKHVVAIQLHTLSREQELRPVRSDSGRKIKYMLWFNIFHYVILVAGVRTDQDVKL